MGKIRILVADDHTLFRQGIRLLLESHEDLEVVGEAVDGSEAVAQVRRLMPDVVLLDIGMPGMDGLMAAREILEQTATTRVLLLTQHENREYLISALKLGVAGYVLKRGAADELVRALRAVYKGQSFLDPAVTEVVLQECRRRLGESTGDTLELLSPREREIMVLMARGYTNREIAGILHLSPKTVDYHRANLMEKLGLQCRAELTRYALQRGLIT